jgi:excisionase family DNA binding protein
MDSLSTPSPRAAQHDTRQRGPKRLRVPLHERLSLSPEEASALSGIGMTSIRQAAASGALKARKLGTRTIILKDDLTDWLRTLPPVGKKLVSETQA